MPVTATLLGIGSLQMIVTMRPFEWTLVVAGVLQERGVWTQRQTRRGKAVWRQEDRRTSRAAWGHGAAWHRLPSRLREGPDAAHMLVSDSGPRTGDTAFLL